MKTNLVGYVLGLSISETEEHFSLGASLLEANTIFLKVVQGLSREGVGISFGHDWREDGILHQIYADILNTPSDKIPYKPFFLNLVPWPAQAHSVKNTARRLPVTFLTAEAGLPESLYAHTENKDIAQGIRALGLTYMRRKLNNVSRGRLCIGGKVEEYIGQCPGILEEAFFAVQQNKPLYLSGILGGASKQIILALENKRIPSKPAFQMENPYAEMLWRSFSEMGVEALAKTNGLSVKENLKLFHSTKIETVLELLLSGLSRINY